MKGFVSVTDNDWFAFPSQKSGPGELNSLPKHSAIITAGGGLDIQLRSQLHQNREYESANKS